MNNTYEELKIRSKELLNQYSFDEIIMAINSLAKKTEVSKND